MVWRETLINTQKINTQNLSFILTHRCYYCLNANRNDLLSFDFLCEFISLSEKSNKKLYGKKICWKNAKTFSLRRNLEYENIYNFIFYVIENAFCIPLKRWIEEDSANCSSFVWYEKSCRKNYLNNYFKPFPNLSVLIKFFWWIFTSNPTEYYFKTTSLSIYSLNF